MLCVTLKANEAVKLDGPGTVRILKCMGNRKVKVGIEAPQTTNILRIQIPEPEQLRRSA
jgi:carbon storage regulator CsrA